MSFDNLAPPYRTIVVDPPWPQKGAGPLTGREGFVDAKGASKRMPYPTMSVAEIADLKVASLADTGAHVYLWTTNGFLRDSFEVLAAWGFSYSTMLVWAKAPMGGGLGGDAYGISTEFVLFGRRGALAADRRIGRTWFNWKRRYDWRGKPMHSAKPEGFFELVEQVSPGPRVELFARSLRLGWDSWGDEVTP